MVERAHVRTGATGTVPPTAHPDIVLITRHYYVVIENIAYFYRDGNNVFIRLITSEDYILNQSLNAIEPRLDKRYFSRVPHYVIANHDAIIAYHPLKHGKLGLTLRPEYREPVYLSKPTARRFKQWFEV
ncbi:hypothetical protein COR50_00275 [Chitinophaga caeni]|uniref:HTH LytTR-type domain-containing protein n=1 Tax=Chitinophaga caeni TaxID=2029983 RepID=A0A291QP13_9BACT|nr:hypothetical protein COR50_00275 [Chitinophaga caeni]